MNITAFSIGILSFHWYGIIIAIAITVGLAISLWQAKLHNAPLEPLFDFSLCVIPVSLIFARVFYVVSNWPLYQLDLLESLYVWHGGLSIYGAIIGFFFAVYFFTNLNNLSFLFWADILSPGLALGQAIGLWANFVNQEVFGFPTDVKWGIYIDYAFRPAGFEQYDYFHPIFLYESGWLLATFLLLTIYGLSYRKNYYNAQGKLFLSYIILFSIGHLSFSYFTLGK